MRTDNNMIQKFTKRIEDLNKQKLLTIQNEDNSQKKNKDPNENDDERTHVFLKRTFKEKDAPQIKFFQKQKSGDQSNQKYPLHAKNPNEKESIRNNDGQQSQSSENQSIEKQKGATPKKNLRSFSKRTHFEREQTKTKKSQLSNSQDDQPQQKEKYQKMKKLLQELKSTKISDQREALIKKAAIKYKIEKCRFKVQLQGYKILFQIQDQIRSLSVQPTKKQLSRRFAKKMLTYVQMNIHEKKYKFINICRVVFKGLKLTKFRTSVWVDKFIHQNKGSLGGINLSEYSSYDLPLMVGEEAKQKNKQKTESNQKEMEKEKEKDKRDKFLESKQKIKLQKNPNNQKKGVKLLREIEQQAKPRSRNQPSKNKKCEQEEKKEGGIEQKGEIKMELSCHEQKMKESVNFLKELENLYEQSLKSSKKMSADIKNNQQMKKQDVDLLDYPETFSKKIANKLDNIFKDQINRVMIEQSKQLCLDKDIVSEMYRKYGSLNLRNISQKKQVQEIMQKKKKHQLEQSFRSDEVEAEEQNQIDPYNVLHSRLSYFITHNIRCTEHQIKDQAIRIATTHPDVKGKVAEQHLALWIHQFLNSMNHKIYSSKVSNALQLINSEQLKLKMNPQNSIYQIKNRVPTHLNPILSRERVIQSINGFKRQVNLPGSRILKKLQTINYATK